MENAELLKQIELLKAQLATANAPKERAKPFGMKVTEKGGVSVYGLGRFPVTLYANQWLRLLEHAEQIKTFIASGIASGVLKTEKPEVKKAA